MSTQPLPIRPKLKKLPSAPESSASSSAEDDWGESASPTSPDASANSSSSAYLLRALWDWAGEKDDDLSLREGDTICFLAGEAGADWWQGECQGKVGWFPANYVCYADDYHQGQAQEYAEQQQQQQQQELQEAALPFTRQLSPTELRDRVVQEIVDTERVYVNVLDMTINGYKKQMEKLPAEYSSKTPDVFGNIEEIYHFQCRFLTELQNVASQKPDELGTLFIREKEHFKMYSAYCANHPKSSALLEEYMKGGGNMKAFFVGCKLLIGQEIGVEGFLLTPIQRLCKYPLLIKEVIKHTPETNPKYKDLQDALKVMQDVASFVNDIQRLKDNKKIFEALQASMEGFEGPDINENNSELLLEATVTKISHGKAQDRRFFLFDHLLVYAKANPLKKNAYLFKGRISLEKFQTKDLPDGTAQQGKSNLTNAWQIDRYDLGDSPKTYVVTCNTPEDKQLWLTTIERAQSKVLMALPLKHHLKVAADTGKRNSAGVLPPPRPLAPKPQFKTANAAGDGPPPKLFPAKPPVPRKPLPTTFAPPPPPNKPSVATMTPPSASPPVPNSPLPPVPVSPPPPTSPEDDKKKRTTSLANMPGSLGRKGGSNTQSTLGRFIGKRRTSDGSTNLPSRDDLLQGASPPPIATSAKPPVPLTHASSSPQLGNLLKEMQAKRGGSTPTATSPPQ